MRGEWFVGIRWACQEYQELGAAYRQQVMIGLLNTGKGACLGEVNM